MDAHQSQNGNSWDFTCQHGPRECTGNIQQSCLIKYVPEQDRFVYAIHCIEQSSVVTNEDTIRQCLKDQANASDEEIDNILTCSNTEEGIQLHHEMGVLTDNLKPKHTYVPWVTFNHEHSDNDDTEDCQFDLFNCLCRDFLQGVPECNNRVNKNVCLKN